MPKVMSRLRRAAGRAVAIEAGDGERTAEDLAAASGRLLDRLSGRLAEVIGPAGVQALFLRALKLQARDSPFLDERVLVRAEGESAGERLHACLRQQEPRAITDAATGLFATFMDLLVTVIGERLGWSLLREALPESVGSDAELQETEE